MAAGLLVLAVVAKVGNAVFLSLLSSGEAKGRLTVGRAVQVQLSCSWKGFRVTVQVQLRLSNACGKAGTPTAEVARISFKTSVFTAYNATTTLYINISRNMIFF